MINRWHHSARTEAGLVGEQQQQPQQSQHKFNNNIIVITRGHQAVLVGEQQQPQQSQHKPPITSARDTTRHRIDII